MLKKYAKETSSGNEKEDSHGLPICSREEKGHGLPACNE